ncbi:hypothetical protein [Burkholderia sp. CCA53]|uniref:hypothetical protein n=1 Tax=Burkholderia sp. CCA53 TaxID=1776288 RepID=UPI001111B518|nr:hypothetical protein [Burkholderia sp. CCA53]
MSFSYVIFCQSYTDPVWGEQIIDWIHSGLVRIHRNRLQKATFEWVGNSRQTFDLEQVRRAYPICMFAPENDSPLSYADRVAPLPDRRKS